MGQCLVVQCSVVVALSAVLVAKVSVNVHGLVVAASLLHKSKERVSSVSSRRISCALSILAAKGSHPVRSEDIRFVSLLSSSPSQVLLAYGVVCLPSNQQYKASLVPSWCEPFQVRCSCAEPLCLALDLPGPRPKCRLGRCKRTVCACSSLLLCVTGLLVWVAPCQVLFFVAPGSVGVYSSGESPKAL